MDILDVFTCIFEVAKIFYNIYTGCNRTRGTHFGSELIVQLKNNQGSTYRYVFYLSSFMRYNECPVLILSYLITCTEDAKNDHLRHSGWLLMFNEFVEKLVQL